MTGTRSSQNVTCDLYLPGHLTHWIQLRRTSEVTPRTGKLVGVEDGIITVEYLDKVGRYRNHRPEEVSEVARPGTKVRVFEDYGLFGIDLDQRTSKSFCIADADQPWVECSYELLISVTAEALAERLNVRGGFSFPGGTRQ
jgi:hypothetical protein